MMVGFQYTDSLNPCSVYVIDTFRKNNLLSCSFSILNCIDGLSSYDPVMLERFSDKARE